MKAVALPGGRRLELERPAIMAVINCTPDSFYAPSRSCGTAAVDRALAAQTAGAALIDIGGESSRPGSDYVSAAEELERVIPVIEGIRSRSPIPISIDTRKAVVADAAIAAGADIINDISALEDDAELGPLCARKGAAVVLMHKRGDPLTMQENPVYDDPTASVREYLEKAVKRALSYGIAADSIIVDPGIGFGKRLRDNIQLIVDLAKIAAAGYPVLVGLSRKSFIGALTGRPTEDRLSGSLAANLAAWLNGAKLFRVHDVAETLDFFNVLTALGVIGG